VNLKEWAAREGVGYATARKWFADGMLPVPARGVGGLILVGDDAERAPGGVAAVYARVSSADQEADLDRQVARVTAWATAEGLTVGRVVTEILTLLYGRPAVADRAARGIAAITGNDGA
jgi:predicted site-specific integrase-resolvase